MGTYQKKTYSLLLGTLLAVSLFGSESWTQETKSTHKQVKDVISTVIKA